MDTLGNKFSINQLVVYIATLKSQDFQVAGIGKITHVPIGDEKRYFIDTYPPGLIEENHIAAVEKEDDVSELILGLVESLQVESKKFVSIFGKFGGG